MLTEESLALLNTVGRPFLYIEVLTIYSYELVALGDVETARSVLKEALALSQEMESRNDSERVLCGLGHLALRQGELAQARRHFEESISLLHGRKKVARTRWMLASCLEGLGEIALAEGQVIRVVYLLATADAVRITNGTYFMIGREQPFYDRTLAQARKRLGEETFATLWAEGQHMTPEQVLAAADTRLATGDANWGTLTFQAAQQSPTYPYPETLTARELEVLRVVAVGLTNKQIAQHLVISPTTVDTHIRSIFQKLGVSTHSSATRYAVEHRLA